MPKGYLLAHINVHDQHGYEEFKKMSLPIIAEYGGRALVRNPRPDVREGSNGGTVIILEFPSIESATKFYESKAYASAKKIREKASTTELVLVEGV